MTTTIYYSPDAIGSTASLFTDGVNVFERVHQLGNLGALDGWLKKIGRKLGKGIKKVARKTFKVVKKVAKVSMKVVKKALPIVNTALTFVPGVGWAAKAALTVAEMGFEAHDRAKARKHHKKQMAELNARITKPVKPVRPVQRIDKAPISQTNNQVKLTPRKPAPPRYTGMDFMRINAAVKRDKPGVDDVINIVRNQVKQNY